MIAAKRQEADTEDGATDKSRPRRMLHEKQVLDIVPLSRTSIYRLERAGKFPRSTYISANRRIWYEDDIVAWQNAVDESNPNRRRGKGRRRATSRAEYARLDPWQGHAPLILTESRAVAGALRNLADQYAVKIAPVGGHVAGFLHNDIAPTLSEGDRVLYIGDWDWQGHQIENNTRRVLEREVGSLNWKRLALTEEQVDHYDLRRLQIMKIDRRYTPGHPGYRFPAVETEALKQQVIVQIVRDALDGELPEPLERVHEREEQQRQEVVGVLAEIDDEQ